MLVNGLDDIGADAAARGPDRRLRGGAPGARSTPRRSRNVARTLRAEGAARAASRAPTATTSPTTSSAGDSSPSASAAISRSSPLTERPSGMRAPRDDGGRRARVLAGGDQPARDRGEMGEAHEDDERPGRRRRAARSRDPRPRPSGPETSVTCAETPRCVTGIPAEAGTADSAETPGTTSNGTPAAASASASSPPRPKTNGSPPFSRTTSSPCAAELDEQRRSAPPGARSSRGITSASSGASSTSSGRDEHVVDERVAATGPARALRT